MVEEDAAAHGHRRIDIGLEDAGGPALQIERQVAASPVPQPVRQTVRLDGMEAFEEEHRLDVAVAGRVAIVDRRDVAAHGLAERLVVGERLLEGAADDFGADDVVAEPLGDAIDDRVFQARLVEHRREDEARHRRLAPDDLLGLALHLEPDRIEALQRFAAARDGLTVMPQLPAETERPRIGAGQYHRRSGRPKGGRGDLANAVP